jgi:DNA-binding GntR family transcriptional regulator
MLETSERFSAFVIGEDQGEVYEVEQRGHAAIVAACRAGDADAAQAALAEHIKVFADIFLRDLGADAMEARWISGPLTEDLIKPLDMSQGF